MMKILYIIRALFNFLIVRFWVSFVPIERNKFFCISMLGNNYGDNIKSLSDYIAAHHPNVQIVWAFTSKYFDITDCPFKKVKLFCLLYYYHILTSKYILNNATLGVEYLIKRKGQICLETWHGTALKRIGTDIYITEGRGGLSRFINYDRIKYNSNMIDVFVSGSRFMTNIYHDKFMYPRTIHEIGTPRNDIFFNKDYNIVDKIKKRYNIPNDTGILLYAPTFRVDSSFEYYNVDLKLIKNLWERKTNKKYVILIRLHPNLLAQEGTFVSLFPQETVDVSLYPDMQELLYVSDLLITDYSSCIFDFMYLYRPVILYVPDRKTYSRGFYLDIDKLPFIIINNNEEIEEKLNAFDERGYNNKVDEFLTKIGSVENGKATEKTYKLLMEYEHE